MLAMMRAVSRAAHAGKIVHSMSRTMYSSVIVLVDNNRSLSLWLAGWLAGWLADETRHSFCYCSSCILFCFPTQVRLLLSKELSNCSLAKTQACLSRKENTTAEKKEGTARTTTLISNQRSISAKSVDYAKCIFPAFKDLCHSTFDGPLKNPNEGYSWQVWPACQ
jgi:hypothetical protein